MTPPPSLSPPISPSLPVSGAPSAPVTNAAPAVDTHVTTETIEQLRREMEQNASRNSDAINAGLSLIEPTLTRMQDRQMETLRTILLVGGLSAVAGFLGLVVVTYLLVRAIGRVSDPALAHAPRALLGGGSSLSSMGALGSGAADYLPVPGRATALEQATGRFQGAIDQMQRRIQELEQSLQSAAPAGRAGTSHPEASNIQPLLSVPSGSVSASSSPAPAGTAAGEGNSSPSRASVLLGKGQALLNLDAADQALQCLEEALSLEPSNAEILVKRGMALEKLQEWERALDSYNRAIASDPTLTVAYLYRGGVCNRLQRYREALESYELALRSEKSEKKSRAS